MPVRREDVERVAEELFSERGYTGTSIADIALRLGIQRGSLYAHIESKEELLYAIVRRAAAELNEAAAPAFDRSLPAPERLRLMVRGHTSVIARHSHRSAVFLTEWRHLTGERLEAVRRLRDAYEDLFRDILRQGVAEGAFAVRDMTVARMAILSVLNWTPQWFREGGRLSWQEAADLMTDVLLEGLEDGRRGGGRDRRGEAAPL